MRIPSYCDEGRCRQWRGLMSGLAPRLVRSAGGVAAGTVAVPIPEKSGSPRHLVNDRRECRALGVDLILASSFSPFFLMTLVHSAAASFIASLTDLPPVIAACRFLVESVVHRARSREVHRRCGSYNCLFDHRHVVRVVRLDNERIVQICELPWVEIAARICRHPSEEPCVELSHCSRR